MPHATHTARQGESPPRSQKQPIHLFWLVPLAADRPPRKAAKAAAREAAKSVEQRSVRSRRAQFGAEAVLDTSMILLPRVVISLATRAVDLIYLPGDGAWTSMEIDTMRQAEGYDHCRNETMRRLF